MAITGNCTDATNQQIIQEMVGETPELVLALDKQIGQIAEKKEKVAEKIAVLEKCVEDYSANKLKAILYGEAYAWTDSQKQTAGLKPKYDRFAGEWWEGMGYVYNPSGTFYNFISLTNKDFLNYSYYRCLITHYASEDNKPPNSTYWEPLTITVYSPYSPVDGDTWVEFGSSYGAKIAGNSLKNGWRIFQSDINDPNMGNQPRPIPLYPLAYSYEAGPFWGGDVKVDTQVIEIIGDWDAANELVTKPMVDSLDPTASASYGLKAIYDALEKAQTYLTNNKNKLISMVPILGKFMK